MNVSLTAELDDFIQTQVESGMYGSASEVVRDGLRLLLRRNAQISQIETVLDERMMDPNRESVDKTFWDDLRSKAREEHTSS